jgi:rod shape-determining protein MreC
MVFWVVTVLAVGYATRLWYMGSPGVFERCSSYVLYPFLVFNHRIIEPTRGWLAKRHTMKQLEECVAVLQAERDDLMADVIELRSQIRYADDIKDVIESHKPLADSTVCVAQVIARNFSDQGYFLLVDAGASRGVEPDMVVVYKRCLVGKIKEVYPWYSKVVTIHDATCKVAATCVASKAAGIHEGRNKKDITSLSYVSHLDLVHVGDYIMSSGQGLVFPRGLGIGQIIAYRQEGLFYIIDVKPLVDVDRIDYCAIIRRGTVSGTCSGMPCA